MSIEPQIQYCTTSDGVNIAYWTMGDGPPLVFLPPQPQHVQLDWQLRSQRSAHEWLATRNQLIRFDARNTGLSDRGVEDVSFAAHERDLATVVERLNLDMLSFYAVGSGNLAITYAAHHPDRVRRMVLVNVQRPWPG